MESNTALWWETLNQETSSLKLAPRLLESMTEYLLLLLSIDMNSSTTNNLLEVVDRFYTIYTLVLPHYMVLASIGTSSSSMLATTVLLDTDFGCNILLLPAMSLEQQR